MNEMYVVNSTTIHLYELNPRGGGGRGNWNCATLREGANWDCARGGTACIHN